MISPPVPSLRSASSPSIARSSSPMSARGSMHSPQEKKRVRPFPLAELPRVGRAQADAARLLLSRLPRTTGPEWDDARRALGGDVTLTLTEIYALPSRELLSSARGAAVKLTLPGGRWALVVVDAQLAPRLARRALGLDEPELGAP